MGNFEGHLYPGLYFFFYGLYHARLVSRALICNSLVQYPPRRPWNKRRWGRLQQIHCTGLLKILSAYILVAQEFYSIHGQLVLISKIYHQRNFMYRKQWQHLTFYMSIFLSGCVDVVSQNLLPQRCAALEQGAQALGSLISLPLMVSHMQDTEGVELQSHMLLTQAMFLLTLVMIAELWAPNEPLIWMMKAFLHMITGTWLMHIGFTLYKPISGYKWMDDDKNDIEFTTTFFCWYVLFSATLMTWIYSFSFVWYRYIFIIGSTNLIILLENEIFADFFNTFLSLPVFGQTPFYTVENSQWSLWPEIPYHLISKYKGLLTWLEKYRLPFFCKTNLCFYYILCQELVTFVRSPEGAKLMRWKKADEWLLKKCIGGVRGMWRFCSYLKGSAGEELVDFWILAEKILSIDEMDLEVRNYYLSLLLVLKATHLQEGSRVVTLCNTNIKSLLNLSIWHPNQSTTRRETLSHMQKLALFKLQSYWLPNFYTHAKMEMAGEGACHGLMQEYETRLCSFYYTHMGGLPLNMSIKKSLHSQKRYSSRKTKRKMWRLTDHTAWSLELDPLPDISTSQEASPQEKVVIQMPSLKVASSKEETVRPLEKESPHVRKSSMKKSKSHLHVEGLFETKFSTHLRTSTPIINHSSQMRVKKATKQSLSLVYTHWALCADACAGAPFRDYLKKLNLKVETRLLDLWQDLHHFLSVLMNNRKNGNALFRHLLGDRICELYLNEKIGPYLPLKSQIIQGLKELLPSGDANPWIPKAQREICKMLSPWYDKFLDEEDYWFLIFTTQNRFIKSRWHRKESTDNKDNILLYKRVQESLKLSQALANMEEMESMQWQKIATEDLRQGGSLQVELTSPVFLEDFHKMTFEELCYKNPKMAIEKISDDYKIYCEKAPKVDVTVEMIKEQRKITSSKRKIPFFKKLNLRKPSTRPRNLTEILLNAQHLQFFREFLRQRKAENPLLFLIAVHKISMETSEKIYKSSLENIIKTYFQGKHPPEEMLQCNAPIIREVSHMQHISPTTLLILQGFVMKSLEEKWFKEYQELFPPHPPEVETKVQTSQRKPSKITTNLQEFQASEEESANKTLVTRKSLPGHCQLSERLSVLPQSPKPFLLGRRGWLKMVSVIKSFCSYRRFISNPRKCQELIEYLHLEMHNKENFSTSPTVSGRLTPQSTSAWSTEQEKEETTLIKRRIYGQRVIVVNFAVNDLYFLSEIEKFNDLVSSAHVLKANQAYNENDVILMHSKINIILRLFLHAEAPPKLRVNITESQKDAILTSIAEGHLDRSTFHGAIMSVFPVIMYFWKRFCSWKAAHTYLQYVGKTFKDRKIPPKPTNKNPPRTSGDHNVLRFSLLKGIEWLQPQQQDILISPLLNCELETHCLQNFPTQTKITPRRKGEEIIKSGPSRGKSSLKASSNSNRTFSGRK